MSKIALKMVEEMHYPWKYGQSFHPDSTEENSQELDQRAITVWKYVCTRIHTYLKNQFENYSKIDNSVNNQKSKICKSNFSKAWKEKRDNMLSREITRQTSLFLL